MRKDNKTLFIILGAAFLLCCCGGFGGFALIGANAVKQVSGDATKEVEAIMIPASETWDASAMAEAVHDPTPQRIEFVQIVFNELKPKGKILSVEGNVNGVASNWDNGVSKKTMTWQGTLKQENGESKATIKLIEMGGTHWRIEDIYLR